MPAYKGRPRYRLKDTRAVYEVDVTYVWDRVTYAAFLDFWANSLEYGSQSFIMSIMLDEAAVYAGGAEQYIVHAVETYTAAYSRWDEWVVTFKVEVPGGFRTDLFSCPELYGGPIGALAIDDIYGGPIDALAEDIITPCPGVDPNG